MGSAPESASTPGYRTPADDAPIVRPLDECDAEQLLARMRAGDRDAAAHFLDRYRSRIEHRIRWKLAPDMRRIFDSQEILSTVGRRLDLYVREGKLRATNAGELHNYIFTIAESALLDKARQFRRVQRVETQGVFAGEIRKPLEGRDDDERARDAREQVDLIANAIDDGIDHTIFRMRSRGMAHDEIAQTVGLSSDNVRQRWSKLKKRLSERFGASRSA
ncbi:MAG: hypothetical protein AAF432_11060 [Planctomycetota bacterium]